MDTTIGFVFQTLASTGASLILLSGLAWLLRQAIQTRLKAAVEHEFGIKIATFQSELRQREEQFKDELRGKAAVMQALQSGALAGQANRQGAADKRRLEAIDQLWAGVIALRPARITPPIWKKFDYKKCLVAAAKNKVFREAFAALGTAGEAAIMQSRGDEARPHVTGLAWAYYEAYRSILSFYVARLMLLQKGIDQDFTDHESVKKVVSTALPHMADTISKGGVDFLFIYLDELLDRLLAEFGVMLAGKETDAESVKRASEILVAVGQFGANSVEVQTMTSALSQSELGAEIAGASPASPAASKPE